MSPGRKVNLYPYFSLSRIIVATVESLRLFSKMERGSSFFLFLCESSALVLSTACGERGGGDGGDNVVDVVVALEEMKERNLREEEEKRDRHVNSNIA